MATDTPGPDIAAQDRDEAAVERMARAIYAGETTWPWHLATEATRERSGCIALCAGPLPRAVRRRTIEAMIVEQKAVLVEQRERDPYFVPFIEGRLDFLRDQLADLDAEERDG